MKAHHVRGVAPMPLKDVLGLAACPKCGAKFKAVLSGRLLLLCCDSLAPSCTGRSVAVCLGLTEVGWPEGLDDAYLKTR